MSHHKQYRLTIKINNQQKQIVWMYIKVLCFNEVCRSNVSKILKTYKLPLDVNKEILYLVSSTLQ